MSTHPGALANRSVDHSCASFTSTRSPYGDFEDDLLFQLKTLTNSRKINGFNCTYNDSLTKQKITLTKFKFNRTKLRVRKTVKIQNIDLKNQFYS